MSHEPRLSQTLRSLIATHRVAALGTLDAAAGPFVSMVPFAVEPNSGMLVLHVSALAAHTRNLQASARVSVLIAQAEVAGEPVHALPRVTLEGEARVLERDSSDWKSARDAYLTRFEEATPMTELGDFMFVGIRILAARQVAGFGAARSLDTQEITSVLRPRV